MHFDPRVAVAQLPVLVQEDQNPVLSRVKEPLRLVSPLVIRLHPPGSEFEELIDLKLPSNGLRQRNGPRRRVEIIQSAGLDEPLIHFDECSEELPYHLDVLLRHDLQVVFA